MTSLASCTGLAILLTAETAPLSRFLPSITIASISTSPFTFSTDPRPMTYGHNLSFLLTLDVVLGIRYEVWVLWVPALNLGLFSIRATASTTASMALPPFWRMAYPVLAASFTPIVESSALSLGIWPAPPCTTTTGSIIIHKYLTENNIDKTKMRKKNTIVT